MKHRNFLAAAALAMATCSVAQAATLGIVERNELAELVQTTGMTVYLTEYCNMPGAKQALIKAKAKEVMAFASTQLQQAASSYSFAYGNAKTRSATIPRDEDCKPTALHDLAENYATFVDARLTPWKKLAGQ